MRLAYVVASMLLAVILASSCLLPVHKVQDQGQFAKEPGNSVHFDVPSAVFHIGSNLSRSVYYVNGSLDVRRGELLTIVNVQLFIEGPKSVFNVTGSVKIYNSTVYVGNRVVNCTAFSLTGNSSNKASVTAYNSNIIFIGIMKADNAALYSRNSSFGQYSSNNSGASAFIFVDSDVVLFKSDLRGLYKSYSTSFFETFSENNTMSPIYRSGTLEMSLDFMHYPSAISDKAEVSVEYSGNNPFSENYILVNVSGSTINRINFNNTGSVTSYAWQNISLPVENLHMNGTTMKSNLVLYYHYDPAEYSNTTIWNITVKVDSNDSVDKIGSRYFRDEFSNSTAYIVDSELGINNMPFNDSYGNPNGLKDYAVISNHSDVYDYGIGYRIISGASQQSPFVVTGNSSLLLGRVVRMYAKDLGSPLNNVSYTLNSSEINYSDQLISENIINQVFPELLKNNLFRGFTFFNGVSDLPVTDTMISGKNSTYFGDYSISINDQVFYFSIPGFPYENYSRIYLNITPQVPDLKVLPITESLVINSSRSLSAFVSTNYTRSIDLFYRIMSEESGVILGSGNETLRSVDSVVNFTITNFNGIDAGPNQIILTLRSSVQTQNGEFHNFTFPVELIKRVSISISVSYLLNERLALFQTTNLGDSSVNNITLQVYENGTAHFQSNLTGIDLKPGQTVLRSLPFTYNSSLELTGKVLLPEIYLNNLSNSSSVIVHNSTNYGKLEIRESGLPENYSWGLFINGTEYEASDKEISVALPLGSYNISFLSTGFYSPEPDKLMVNLSVSQVNVTINYLPQVMTLSIESIGLPTGEIWEVNVSGNVLKTGGSQISVNMPAGEYVVSVIPASGFYARNTTFMVELTSNKSIEIVFFRDSHGPLYPVISFLDASYQAILIILISALIVVEYRKTRSVIYSPLHKGIYFKKRKVK